LLICIAFRKEQCLLKEAQLKDAINLYAPLTDANIAILGEHFCTFFFYKTWLM